MRLTGTNISQSGGADDPGLRRDEQHLGAAARAGARVVGLAAVGAVPLSAAALSLPGAHAAAATAAVGVVGEVDLSHGVSGGARGGRGRGRRGRVVFSLLLRVLLQHADDGGSAPGRAVSRGDVLRRFGVHVCAYVRRSGSGGVLDYERWRRWHVLFFSFCLYRRVFVGWLLRSRRRVR